MFHMQESRLSLSSLFKKKPVHNAIRHFSCFFFVLFFLNIFPNKYDLAFHVKHENQSLFFLKSKKKSKCHPLLVVISPYFANIKS